MRTLKCLLLIGVALPMATCVGPLQPVSWTAEQEATIENAISLVSGTQINSVLSDLNIVRSVTVATSAQLTGVENAILNRFTSYGLSAARAAVATDLALTWDPATDTNGYTIGSFTMDNLIATRTGTNPDLAPVLVTAHWDSMPQTVGMDDNASGCAGVLEVARVLQGLPLTRTVIFAIFSFEESGLVGSTAYAAGMTVAPYAVINLEMIGFTSAVQNALPLTDVLLTFPTVGDFIGVVASDSARNLGLSFCTTAAQFVPQLSTYYIGADANLQNNPLLTDFLRSDQTPFWGKGVPALMVTDTSFLREGTKYHTPEDTIATLDIPFMVKVIQATASLTCLEAGLP